ncbi:unnamed protein product, partial [marine sediment metagenome]
VSLYLGQRVLMEKAEDWRPPRTWTEFDTKYSRKVTTAMNWDERTEIGSIGKPTLATREKGEKMVKAVIEEISAFIEDLKLE